MLEGYSSKYIVQGSVCILFYLLFPKQIITWAIKRYYAIPKTATDLSLCQLCTSKRRDDSNFQSISSSWVLSKCTICFESFPTISNLISIYDKIFCQIVPVRHRHHCPWLLSVFACLPWLFSNTFDFWLRLNFDHDCNYGRNHVQSDHDCNCDHVQTNHNYNYDRDNNQVHFNHVRQYRLRLETTSASITFRNLGFSVSAATYKGWGC